MSITIMPAETLYKTPAEVKTFGFDYQQEGAVKAGETLSSPVVSISGSSGIAIGLPEIVASDFLDGGSGKKIPGGKGVKVRLSGGTPGKYTITCSVTTSGGDLLQILGVIDVTASLVV